MFSSSTLSDIGSIQPRDPAVEAPLRGAGEWASKREVRCASAPLLFSQHWFVSSVVDLLVCSCLRSCEQLGCRPIPVLESRSACGRHRGSWSTAECATPWLASIDSAQHHARGLSTTRDGVAAVRLSCCCCKPATRPLRRPCLAQSAEHVSRGSSAAE